MSLTSKLIADYVDLIDHQLNRIPVSNIEDFDSIQEALSNIINPIAGYSVPERLRDDIVLVSEIFNFPENYVESENDYNEFKNIIHTRINAKIAEFLAFNQEQKRAYANAQYGYNILYKNHPLGKLPNFSSFFSRLLGVERRRDAVQSQQQIPAIEPRESNILSENDDEQVRFNQAPVDPNFFANAQYGYNLLFKNRPPEERPDFNLFCRNLSGVDRG